ncbi:MAG: DUF835 domain-containing protein [Euryarchaeota archaeon]|nr:DUF835 domain-containing protein [Euryarchaeota archaeon]
MGNRLSIDSGTVAALRALEEQKSSRDDANWLIYQYGKSIGQSNNEGIRCDMAGLPRTAVQSAISDGILNIEVTIGESISIKSSGERAVDDDYFCAGYLAGMVSEMLGEPYVAGIREGKFELVKSSKALEMKRPAPTPHLPLNIPELERGESYLIVDEVKNAPSTFKVFVAAVSHGMPGLCVTRIFPPRVLERYLEVTGAEFQTIWLSTTESSAEVNSIKPERYDHELYRTISAFLKEGKGVVMLHGIEFLISNNQFTDILKFAQRIRDTTSVSGGIFLIAVDPSTLDPIDYNNLKSEFTVYGA